MSNQENDYFIRVPVSLKKSSLWNDLPGRSFILYICDQIRPFNQFKRMNGVDIILEPMEFIFGREFCAEQAFITQKQCRLRWEKFKKEGFCEEVIEKRASTFTVYRLNKKGQHHVEKGQQKGQQNVQHFENENIDSQLCEKLILDNIEKLKGPAKGPAKGPDSIEREDSEDSFAMQKSATKSPFCKQKNKSLFSRPSDKKICAFKDVSPEQVDFIQEMAKSNQIELQYKSVQRWLTTHPLDYIIYHVEIAAKRQKKDPKKNIESYIERLLKKNLIQESRNIEINKKFAEKVKVQHPSIQLNCKGFIDNKTTKDFSFLIDPQKFKSILEEEYKLNEIV
jgi:hypothetical protein